MEKQRIPADFLIGTSSSAWQIEGCAGKKEGHLKVLFRACFRK